MSLPTLSGVGRLTADPELRFSSSGGAVLRMNLAFNARKKDQNGNWVDGDSFFIRATAFGATAEAIAESLTKGMEVHVSGRLKTEQWESNGEKRTAPALLVDAIGPALGYQTAKVAKAERSGGTPQRAQRGPASDDPWGGGWGGNSNSEPPPF